MKLTRLIFFISTLLAAAAGQAFAQAKTVWDGVYTQQQAARGSIRTIQSDVLTREAILK